MDPHSTIPRKKGRNFGPKTCAICGAEFYGFTPDARYCSHRCYCKDRPSRIERICQTCGKLFLVYPNSIKGEHKGLFCSLQCRGPRIAEVHRGKVVTERQKIKQSIAMKAKPPKPIGKPYVLTCEYCKKEYTKPARQGSLAKVSRFCSSRCWYDHVREHPEANGRYLGGRFPYYGANWNEQARLARKRDNYTCQDCGVYQTNPKLDVHHVIPRRDFDGDWVRANHLDNLITLCKSCHTKRKRR
jgi:5-methylcytosine-specific restriction endonuclease McrA